jgi:hypothetical protein
LHFEFSLCLSLINLKRKKEKERTVLEPAREPKMVEGSCQDGEKREEKNSQREYVAESQQIKKEEGF